MSRIYQAVTWRGCGDGFQINGDLHHLSCTKFLSKCIDRCVNDFNMIGYHYAKFMSPKGNGLSNWLEVSRTFYLL